MTLMNSPLYRRKSANDWSRHQGPQGGTYWQNAKTGEKKYQEQNPGGSSGGAAQGDQPQGDRIATLAEQVREKFGDQAPARLQQMIEQHKDNPAKVAALKQAIEHLQGAGKPKADSPAQPETRPAEKKPDTKHGLHKHDKDENRRVRYDQGKATKIHDLRPGSKETPEERIDTSERPGIIRGTDGRPLSFQVNPEHRKTGDFDASFGTLRNFSSTHAPREVFQQYDRYLNSMTRDLADAAKDEIGGDSPSQWADETVTELIGHMTTAREEMEELGERMMSHFGERAKPALADFKEKMKAAFDDAESAAESFRDAVESEDEDEIDEAADELRSKLGDIYDAAYETWSDHYDRIDAEIDAEIEQQEEERDDLIETLNDSDDPEDAKAQADEYNQRAEKEDIPYRLVFEDGEWVYEEKSLKRRQTKAIRKSAPTADDALDVIADILGGLLGDKALQVIDDEHEDSTKSLARSPLYRKAFGFVAKAAARQGTWQTNGRWYKREGGRTIRIPDPNKKQQPAEQKPSRQQRQEAAKQNVADIIERSKAGQATADDHSALIGHMQDMTVAQLQEVRKQHGLKAPPRLKAQIIERLAEHFKQRNMQTKIADDATAKQQPSQEERAGMTAGDAKKPAAKRKPSKNPEPANEQPAKPNLDQFADAVHDIADAAPQTNTSRAARGARYFDNKIFLHHVRAELQKRFPGMTRDEIDASLVDANQQNKIDLSRADLAEAMHPDDMRESELDLGLGSKAHFVRLRNKRSPYAKSLHASPLYRKSWDESKHPRDHGKFTAGSSEPTSAPTKPTSSPKKVYTNGSKRFLAMGEPKMDGGAMWLPVREITRKPDGSVAYGFRHHEPMSSLKPVDDVGDLPGPVADKPIPPTVYRMDKFGRDANQVQFLKDYFKDTDPIVEQPDGKLVSQSGKIHSGKPVHGMTYEEWMTDGKTPEEQDRVRQRLADPDYQRSEGGVMTRMRHQEAVMRAQRQGLQPPAHVLAEYAGAKSLRVSPLYRRKSIDTDQGDDTERIALMAEILASIFGDEALKLFDVAGKKSLRSVGKAWDAVAHPRGPNGRFIPKNSPEAAATAKDAIKDTLKQGKTPQTMNKLVEHLNLLSVKQLHELKKEYQLSASGKAKDELVKRLAERLGKGRIGEDAPAVEGESPSYKQWAAGEREANKRKRETPKEPEKPTKKPAKKTSDHLETLAAVIIKQGGLSLESVSKDWNISEDVAQSGLLARARNKDGTFIPGMRGIFRKTGGVGLDDMAQQLEAAGHIKVPANRNADDYLMELLQNKATSLHADMTKQMEAEQAKYYQELEDAKRYANQSEVEAAVRAGEEAGRAEGEGWEAGEGDSGMADEEGAGGEVGDFEFGAGEGATTPVEHPDDYERRIGREFVDLVNRGESGYKPGTVKLDSQGNLLTYGGKKFGWTRPASFEPVWQQASRDLGVQTPFHQRHHWMSNTEEGRRETQRQREEEDAKQQQENSRRDSEAQLEERAQSEPHTLTRSQYEGVDLPLPDPVKNSRGFIDFTKAEAKKYIEANDSDDVEFKVFNDQDHNGRKTGKVNIHAKPTHQKLVKDALAAGKPVPPEVLADYPDLAKPTAAKPLQGSPLSADAETKKKYGEKTGIELRRAPAGGAVSDVDGVFYAGGRLMPIHGLSPKTEKKPKGDGIGTAEESPNENAEQKQRQRTERGPMSPEGIEAERQRRADVQKWQEMNAGPLGKIKWLGDNPNHRAASSGWTEAKKWQAFAEELGPDGVKRLVETLEPLAHKKIEKMSAEAHAHRTSHPMPDAYGSIKVEPHDAGQWEKDDLKRRADDTHRGTRNFAGHEKKHPGSWYARELVHELLDTPKGQSAIDNMHEINRVLADVAARRGQKSLASSPLYHRRPALR